MEPKPVCRHCEKTIRDPNPRIKNQTHCHAKACQRARKAKWQREKIKTDPDYRKNQKDAKDQWGRRNPDYWEKYRRNNEAYTLRNRELQKVRDAKRRALRLAKMDASSGTTSLNNSVYFLIHVAGDLAKMDASIHRVVIIPDPYGAKTASCKIGLDGPEPPTAIKQTQKGGDP
jgi:23S rRNA G2445 N2-methylase RlmL